MRFNFTVQMDVTFNFEPCCNETTYVSLEDAMQTQKDVGTENIIKMTWDAQDNNRISNDVMVKHGWPSHILMCQKLDTDEYGTAFPPISVYRTLKRTDLNTHLLWMVSVLLTRIKKLWSLTDQYPI